MILSSQSERFRKSGRFCLEPDWLQLNWIVLSPIGRSFVPKWTFFHFAAWRSPIPEHGSPDHQSVMVERSGHPWLESQFSQILYRYKVEMTTHNTRGISFWHSFLVREIFIFSKVLFWHIFWMIQILFWHIFQVNDWLKMVWLTHCMSHSIFTQSLTRKMCQNEICIIQKMCQNKIFEKMKISLTRKLCQKEIPRVFYRLIFFVEQVVWHGRIWTADGHIYLSHGRRWTAGCMDEVCGLQCGGFSLAIVWTWNVEDKKMSYARVSRIKHFPCERVFSLKNWKYKTYSSQK